MQYCTGLALRFIKRAELIWISTVVGSKGAAKVRGQLSIVKQRLEER
jgi:hypothetical protein